MEDEEALETSAVISDTANFIQNLVDEFFADSIVTTGVVVGCIFLASYHMLRVEEASVGASADFVDDIGLEIAVDGSWDIFALAWNAIGLEVI